MNGHIDMRLAARDEKSPPAKPAIGQGGSSNAGRWQRFWRRVATRRALLHLEPHELRDIGVSLAEARKEGAKPFWR